ncbi:MAG: DUF1116 domain-containing protein [Oscillospiraceae bacterium]
MAKELFGKKLSFLNVGTPLFKAEVEKQNTACLQVDWKPVAGGNIAVIDALDRLMADPRVDAANAIAAEKIKQAHAVLVDMDLAINVIPGMTANTFLHAGPPIEYERMCGPMQGAIIGAILFEEMAKTREEADTLARSGKIRLAPCHLLGAVGPMAGITSASMPVHVVKNMTDGNLSYSNINEGLGKVLRFGANSDEVINRLRFMRDTFMPVFKKVIALSGGVDLKNITAQSLHMGDECHNRNKAATSLLIRELLPFFMDPSLDRKAADEALLFLSGNDHYYLNLSMAACKCSLDAAQGVPYSTVVTTMARNGVDFGIRVSGMPADKWFIGPAMMVQGLMFPGFEDGDAAPDLGDSAITETCGIGGFAMAAAPAIVQFVGGCVEDALNYSRQMYEITESENINFTLPPLDFRGTAVGIDVRKVLATGILPIINTGMAHREAGVGQVGAGIVHPPVECFNEAAITCAAAL